ncbi:hypothetical protein MAR_002803 [Mya arenaria]|uniref:DUF6589 domain-containing protein n=1 Tax=Mya arenaria TaxID=6604 RepID=A0ABY7G4Z2_MYAAR|nr:hypothetical protein MAR_002803 [Mya arenaria]
MMYYAMLDAIILVMFFEHFGINCLPENSSDLPEIPIPEDMLNEGKISWINNVCEEVVKKWFFEGSMNMPTTIGYQTVMILDVSNVITVKDHTRSLHPSKIMRQKNTNSLNQTERKKNQIPSADDLQDYILMLFKLTILHKNLDSAVDMGDGERCVRSAKYKLPVYNKTNKTKYLIGSVHLTALTEEVFPHHQRERLVANRFINIQGGGGGGGE